MPETPNHSTEQMRPGGGVEKPIYDPTACPFSFDLALQDHLNPCD